MAFDFLISPAILIALCLAGAWLGFYRRRFGMVLTLVAAFCLYVCATPVVASFLLSRIEDGIPAGTNLAQAQAIVVLGGDIRRGRGGHPDTLGPESVERLDYAAQAYHRLHLPVLVSGGRVGGSRTTEAALMKTALETDFGVPVTWAENRSRTTFENALYTRALLQPAHIDTVVLVTHAWHMPRALWSFAQVGLHALPWPAPRDNPQTDRIADYLPSAAALHDTYYACHEWIGAASTACGIDAVRDCVAGLAMPS